MHAKDLNLENAMAVRFDSTVIETNIHYPKDLRLIFDCVKVVSRVLKKIRTKLGRKIYSPFSVKIAKKLLLKIVNGKNDSERQGPYKEMIRLAQAVLKHLESYLVKLDKIKLDKKLTKYREELNRIVAIFPRVIDQSKQRIVFGKTVPAEQMIVSIFEDHTDVIIKGKRQVEFGHKVFFATGKSGLITDCLVEKGSPTGKNLFLNLLQNHKIIYGSYPEKTTADGGFASQYNVDAAPSVRKDAA